ncbi:TonB family protein [Pedobacter insulae]|uniref:TonB family C-terminal domain-containing protein n=1 Tax=Pedobacter insulae TaxID=414048 RepID=A0A1I2SWM3_9SPHI|nr:TonB family protein [Pedobacter insulae]SFG56978.1 TonB family C-terminal domain-containing protein [Pedobacter insulae]
MNLLVAFLIFFAFSARAQEPALQGGLEEFLKRNTLYPAFSLQNCIQGTVDVGFKLNSKGEVYSATIIKGIGTDLDDEALRLIKLSSGKWILPANHDTLSLVLIPMSFSLSGYGCESKDKNAIAMAIRAYKAETELTNVVMSYYKRKEKGNTTEEEELTVLKIKSDLGINEEYLEEKISAGLKKIKQGDRDGACVDFNFVKYMGSDKANDQLAKYCN